MHLSKLAEQVMLFYQRRVWLLRALGCLFHRLEPDAAKEKPGHVRADRGKAGTLIGLLTGLLATLKGLPSTYDKDLQEDKVPVFQAFDTLLAMLPVLAGALQTLTACTPNGCGPPSTRPCWPPTWPITWWSKGVPFRAGHGLVGQAVQLAASKEKAWISSRLDELKSLTRY